MKKKKANIIASVYPFPFFIGTGHDTNFSLIKGDQIFSQEEGKISGVVNSRCERFPERSIFSALKYFNINPSDIDHWVFGNSGKTPREPALKYFFSKFKTKSYEELMRTNSISFIQHHLAHGSLAIYGSGYSDGVFVCMDDGGDESFPYDTAWGIFKGNKIKMLGRYNKGGWGLSRFHNFICESIGYLGNVDNGKVMGLASYGKVNENLYKEFRKILLLSKDGFSAQFLLRHNKIISKPRYNKLKLDAYEYKKVINSSNPPEELKRITKNYSSLDIAATGQKVVEDITVEIINNMLKYTKKKKLVCSGGFFQNISVNRKLTELNLDGLYVPSAPNDAGLSLGAALFCKMSFSKSRPKKFLSPYLGLEFTNKEIKEILDEFKLQYKESKNVCQETANLLNQGKVVGWFQGRSELGPRSLGARSVLADPRNIDNKAKINQLLKKRDWFMPYAPSILYDKMNFFYEKKMDCPYMSYSTFVKKNLDKIPAAVHVDKSSRPQTIKKEEFPKYYNLINEFYKITKIPAVLNTSFNRHGLATIQTPRQAIEHLLNGSVEILVIGDFIVFDKKKESIENEKIYAEEYYLVIEKIRHIIEALVNNDKSASKIIKENKKMLDSKKISFDLKRKELIMDGRRVKFNSCERNILRNKLFPMFDNIDLNKFN